MMTIKQMFLVGGVALSFTFGCANEAITSVSPVPAGAKAPATGGSGSMVQPVSSGGTPGTTPVTPAGGTQPPVTTGGTTAPVTPTGGTAAPSVTAGMGAPVATGGMTAAVTGGMTAPVPTAGGASPTAMAGSGAGGSGSGTMALPPCPSGWKCSDPAAALTSMGLEGKVTDQMGQQVKFACGKADDSIAMCTDDDLKTSCAGLTNPFCAHVNIPALGGEIARSCAQTCTP